MKHNIILPEFPILRNSEYMISRHISCLLCLPAFNDEISVVCSNELLKPYVDKILSNPPPMSNKNGRLSGLFVVNDHVFMFITTDRPVDNAQNWVPYYSQYVSGFFLCCHRHSTSYIFDNCGVPVFPVGFCPDRFVPMHYMEHGAHTKSMTCEKDISVFFQGRYSCRGPRRSNANMIKSKIPNARIANADVRYIPGNEYLDLMCRSKIVWSPRTVKCPPDFDCNSTPGKEGEAMCLECLLVKNPIGVTEPEKRIPGVHFVEYDNYSTDLIEKLEYYLKHEDERKEIAHNGRLWWERNCSTLARAKQIFSDCLSAIGCEYSFWVDKIE